MCASKLTTMKKALALGLLATSMMMVGCAAEPAAEEGVADDESALTDAEKDDRRIAAIRAKVGDVTQEQVSFSSRTKSPVKSPSSGSRNETTSLYGVDWFQKWDGGLNADHGWENGSELGKRCMWASVLRFEAIMKEPPAELKAFLAEYTRWGGSFYNWVDDYSKPESYGDASTARLWSWRTGLSKWISAAAKDGSCYLPTKQMVIDYAKTCKEHAAGNGGEMQGCDTR